MTPTEVAQLNQAAKAALDAHDALTAPQAVSDALPWTTP
jgi:hypothetical protein